MSTLELDLFSDVKAKPNLLRANQEIMGLIRGLDYIRDFVTEDEEERIVHLLDSAPWSCELSRRVQHYGFRYDYKSRRINEEMRVGELPQWLKDLGKRLVDSNIFDSEPDQVIVNEYLPGQGISAHVDCQPCFGDTIASLSLGSTCIMEFTDAKQKDTKSVLLEPHSVVVLKEDARYLWKHSIAKRKQDTFDGTIYPRSRRVSLTFRTVKWE